MADDKGAYGSGLSEAEAKEFHGMFMMSFFIFFAIAVVAHILAWFWRPWLPGVNGYGMIDGATHAVHTALALLS
jgi:light-harvesting complex 1 beta chain